MKTATAPRTAASIFLSPSTGVRSVLGEEHLATTRNLILRRQDGQARAPASGRSKDATIRSISPHSLSSAACPKTCSPVGIRRCSISSTRSQSSITRRSRSVSLTMWFSVNNQIQARPSSGSAGHPTAHKLAPASQSTFFILLRTRKIVFASWALMAGCKVPRAPGSHFADESLKRLQNNCPAAARKELIFRVRRKIRGKDSEKAEREWH